MFSKSARGLARGWLSLLIVSSAVAASAAEPPAAVAGRVLDPQGAPVAGVEVHLRGEGAPALSGLTGADGTFRIAVPAAGTYRVVCVIGARVETGPEVTVAAGALVSTEVALRLGVSEEISVTADAWTLPADLPTTASTRGREELSGQNLVNPEDALKYVPSTTIRKRYIGDRNALLGGRSFGTLQPSRGLVLPRRLPAVELPGPLRRAALEHGDAGGARARRRALRAVLRASTPATPSAPRS